MILHPIPRVLPMTTSIYMFSGRRLYSNITPRVQSLVGRNLHQKPSHPLRIIKDRIENYFHKTFTLSGQSIFQTFDNLDPYVSAQQNFDDLLIKPDHVSRRPSDTFYVNKKKLLRTHTSAHQTELLRAGHMAFLATGDCYRRDEIDSCHYPVFHQMEGVRMFDPSVSHEFIVNDLKQTLEGLVQVLFGNVKVRWVEAYFPFTDPSIELEIFFNNEWLEVLGCGVIQRDILKNCDLDQQDGWAFGLGLERLAMVLFDIPDIRLFWSEDERFLNQFSSGSLHGIKFKPFSKYPPCLKDISFWSKRKAHEDEIDSTDVLLENDFCAIVREVAGDIVENVSLVDEFIHPKTNKYSRCYRVTYRSLERTLMNEEVNVLNEAVREKLGQQSIVELR